MSLEEAYEHGVDRILGEADPCYSAIGVSGIDPDSRECVDLSLCL